MPIRINGLNVLGYGVQWVKVDSESDLARRLILLLEDRRVLFGPRHLEDEYECVRSVLSIRSEIGDLIVSAKPGQQLERSMRAIRSACRGFLDLAGPDGSSFHHGFHAMPGNDLFSRALAELRVLVGLQVGLIANYYSKVELTAELASIVPRAEDDDDLDWVADQLR